MSKRRIERIELYRGIFRDTLSIARRVRNRRSWFVVAHADRVFAKSLVKRITEGVASSSVEARVELSVTELSLVEV